MDDEKTTINVKAVSARAWERAKASADKQGETLGAWLSRAVNQLADAEAGPREFPPMRANLPAEMVKPRSAGPVSPAELAGVMQGLAALAAATGVPPAKAYVRRAYRLADDFVREARGMPRPARIAGQTASKALLEHGEGHAVPTGGRDGAV